MSSSDKPLENLIDKSHESTNTVSGDGVSRRDTFSLQDSRNETGAFTVRVELPLEDYVALAKRAAQEGVTPEQLMAQAVGKMLA